MRRKGLALLVSLIAVLSMVMVPAAFTTEAAPQPCSDIKFTIDYTDPATSLPVTLFDDSNAKFGVPVETDLLFTIFVNPALANKEVKFGSPNQFLQLIAPPLGANSVSDGGIIKYNVPSTRQNVNFEIRWPTGGDGVLTFHAKIHADNLLFGNPDHTKGALMTLGARVQGGRCSAKIEIYGIPAPPPPGPDLCPGIIVDMYYEWTDGNFYPVKPDQQNSNVQYDGPGVNFRVKYVITTPVTPLLFIIPVKETDSFNRQTILSASANPVGPVITINNAGPVRKVTFNPWKGETKTIFTRALTQGLDTVTFVSTNVNGTVNNLCSTHREVRISAAPVDPLDP
jgi:hypothetical protein